MFSNLRQRIEKEDDSEMAVRPNIRPSESNKSVLSDLFSKLSHWEYEIHKKQSQLEVKDSMIEDLRGKIKSLEERDRENGLLDDELAEKLKEDRNELMKVNDQLASQLRSEKEGMVSIDVARGWLDNLRDNYAELESQLKSHLLEESGSNRTKLLKEFQARQSNVESEMRAVEGQLSLKETECSNLLADNQQYKMENWDLMQELQAFHDGSRQIERKNEEKICDLSNQLVASQTECDNLKLLVKAQQSRLEGLKKVLKREASLRVSNSSESLAPSTEDHNFVYMKHVVLKFMMSGFSESLSLVSAVSTLLRLSAEEEELLVQTLNYRSSWFRTNKPSYGKGQFSRVIP